MFFSSVRPEASSAASRSRFLDRRLNIWVRREESDGLGMRSVKGRCSSSDVRCGSKSARLREREVWTEAIETSQVAAAESESSKGFSTSTTTTTTLSRTDAGYTDTGFRS